jgi:glycine C-acetyltransferase
MGGHTDSDRFTQADFLTSPGNDLFEKAASFRAFLRDWKQKQTYSYHRLVCDACTNTTVIRDRVTKEDRRMVVLASNNYLGLNTDPRVQQAAMDAITTYGTGMCGSRFLSGTYDLIETLERELAAFEHCEDAMVFTSGYQANVGTISAILRPDDTAIIDRLSHASIVDGCKLSGATLRTFRHNDMASLERCLRKSQRSKGGRLIAVDGVFSMDGDMAPLPQIIDLARGYNARVLVDEAHATGVVGPSGGGTVEHFGLQGKVDIVLGTFSKTFAATGGFIAASREITDYVQHYGRSYMFSASPTPATVATALTGLRILQKEPEHRERLWRNIQHLHDALCAAGFNVFPSPPESAVLTLPAGEDLTVRALSKRLYEEGVFASTVAYPAVPRNQGKIRLSVSALHTEDNLDFATAALQRVGEEFGVI